MAIATDATGTPTSLGIRKLAVGDAPSINGINGMMDDIDTLLAARITKATLTTRGDLMYASAANTPARLAIGTSGYVLTSNGTDPAWAAPTSTGAMTLLGSQVLSGTQATFDTNTILGGNISGSYNHLRIVWMGRGASASTYANLLVNNDATAGNYLETSIQISGTTLVGIATSSGTWGLRMGFLAGTGDPASQPGAGTIDIPVYAGTTFYKNVIGSNVGQGTNGGQFYGMWKSTSAITRLALAPDTGSWAAGSAFYLYGVL